MNVSEQQQKNRWSSLFSDVSQKWLTISILGLACLAIVVISWNSRYEAGYRAGAGEGTAYKPLHEQAQVKIATLEKQHEKDSNEIQKYQKRIGQLEGKIGLFKTNITQAQAEKTLNQVEQERVEFEQQRLEQFEQSVEIGKTYGRLEELDRRNQELSNELVRKNKDLRWRDIIIFALLTVGFILARFFPERSVSSHPHSPYQNPKAILTSAAVLDSPPVKSLTEEDNAKQKALPTGAENIDSRIDHDSPQALPPEDSSDEF